MNGPTVPIAFLIKRACPGNVPRKCVRETAELDSTDYRRAKCESWAWPENARDASIRTCTSRLRVREERWFASRRSKSSPLKETPPAVSFIFGWAGLNSRLFPKTAKKPRLRYSLRETFSARSAWQDPTSSAPRAPRPLPFVWCSRSPQRNCPGASRGTRILRLVRSVSRTPEHENPGGSSRSTIQQ